MDEFLEVGGPWHWPVLALNAYVAVPHAWFVMAPSFMAPSKQDFWCASDSAANQSSDDYVESHWTPTTNPAGDTTQLLRCMTNSTGQLEKCARWEFDTSDFRRTFQMDFETVCEREVLNSVHRSVLMAGLMVGNFAFSHLSDWFGRRRLIFVCIAVQLLFNLVVLASPDFNWLLIITFLSACGYGGLQNIPFAMTMESVGPSSRAFVSTCEEVGWIVGLAIFPLFTYLLTDWRYLQLALILPVLVTLLISLFCDESPRWLVANGHLDRARDLLMKIGKKNAIENCATRVEGILQKRKGEKDAGTRKVTVLDLFYDRNLGRMACSFFVQFAVSILLYYSLIFFIVDVGTNPHLNLFVSGLLELPLIPICYVSLKKLRRGTLYALVYLPPLVASMALAFLPAGWTWVEMSLAMISKWASQVLFTLLVVHVAECFPTQVRALAVGTSLTISRIGAIVAPFINLLDARWRNALCVVVVVMGYLWSLVLPETSHEALPDTLTESRLKFGANSTAPPDVANRGDASTR